MRKLLGAPGFLAVVGFSLGLALSGALGARNSVGTYSLPSGNPVVTGTTITSSWANTTLSDISTELTNSLDRAGRGAMSAPLQLSNGTSSAPSLTFGTDTDTGLYRAGAGDARMQVDATHAQTWTSALTTVVNGLTVTETTANSSAITSTGTGTGAGLTCTGGTTSGAGIVAAGGSPNGHGATASGAGTGTGLTATGGPTGTGVVGTAGSTNGSHVGVAGLGGAGGNAGGYFEGTVNNNGSFHQGHGTGHGLRAVGGATGSGVVGVAGSTTGTNVGVSGIGGAGGNAGGYFEGTANNNGSYHQGHGTASGVEALGGATGAGGTFRAGTDATTGTRRDAIAIPNGDISFAGTADPSTSVGIANRLTVKNLVKAWAYVTTDGIGGVSVVDGFNIASCTISTSTMTCNIQTDMANSSYAVVHAPNLGATAADVNTRELPGSRTNGSIALQIYSSTVAQNWELNALGISFIILGAQ